MTAPTEKTTAAPKPLHGLELVFAALMLAVSNFVVVLDMTIANVSVSHIAGGLAVSISEGTYVITSYAVAEAITVPLTGWLAQRFGTLRVFTGSIMLFGLFSILCGFANSLGLLVAGRIFQGLAGGPIMPLSQTLMMQVFPKDKQGVALGLWSMTTLIAPILGPITGGYICDNWGWGYIFFINIPIAMTCSYVLMQLLKRFETPIIKRGIDYVGLGLLMLWVAALQIMLDKGKDYDWFESPIIWALCIIAVVGFACFLIWEFTEEHPIVDLRVFRHRGFSASVFTISLAFGSFFSAVVLTPLWLQNYMGYTATWSGFTTAAMGVLAVFAAPFAAKYSQKVDPRRLVFCGVLWLGCMTAVRSYSTTDMTHWMVSLPMLLQGIGMPFFFVPLTGLALACVDKDEIASAAGLMSFLRTLSGAFATSIVTTAWENDANLYRNELAGQVMSPQQLAQTLGDVSQQGQGQALYILNQLVQEQAVMLATNHIFQVVAATFVVAAAAVWLAPKPTHKVAPGAGGH
jgi:DHA2 family multidrug resistance protein